MAEEKEFDFEYSELREDHTFSLNPTLHLRLKEVAKRHYEGSVSRAIDGLALHEWMVEAHRLSKGLGLNTHWISAPLVMRPGELAPVLKRLLGGDVDYVGSYFDQRMTEAADEEKRALRERVAELEAEVARLRAQGCP